MAYIFQAWSFLKGKVTVDNKGQYLGLFLNMLGQNNVG
jgi:hypothetical protein